MRNSRISSSWLSDEMAHALAAMWPPLEATAVMRAADELTAHAPATPGVHLVRDGDTDDKALAPGVVEALRALHDLGA
jgi:hypothetical protein